jgi:ABC-type lipoprotein export system ATPase subunit
MLEIIGVSKTYRTAKNIEVKALKNISLTFPRHGLIFIVGKSGAGKSTLLNVIGGLDGYDAGDIIFNGKSASDFRARDFDSYRNTYAGFIFQEYNLIEAFTVAENIKIAGELQGKKITDKEINGLLEKLDLQGYASRKANELSSGEKQRVAIARALVKKPAVILADEPTGSLDSETGNQILKILKAFSRERLIIVVSHDLELANRYADRVITIKDGQVVSDTAPVSGISTKEDIREFRAIPARFPLKSAFRIAWSDFLRKPARLAFITTLLAVSFILFGIVLTLGGYDLVRCTDATMKKSGINYLSWEREDSVDLGPYGRGAVMSRISPEDIDELSGKYPDYRFFPVIPDFYCQLFDNLHYSETAVGYPELTGGIELSAGLIEAFRLDLFAGRYPVATPEENEIAISKHVYELFESYAHIDGEGEITLIDKPEDLLGKSLLINEKPRVIVGIIDTRFNSARYRPLFEGESETLEYDILCDEYQAAAKYGIQNLVFLRENYYRDVINGPEFAKTYYDGIARFTIYLGKPDDPDVKSKISLECEKISVLKEIPDRVIWRDGCEKTALGENEILLPISIIPRNAPVGKIESLQDLIAAETETLVDAFAIERYDEIREQFELIRGPSTPEDYAYYILNNIYKENKYHPGYDIWYFEKQAEEIALQNHYLKEFADVLLAGSFEFLERDYHVTIAGFYECAGFRDNECDYPLIVADGLYEEISKDLRLYPYSRLIVSLDKETDNKPFIKMAYDRYLDSATSAIIINEVMSLFLTVNVLFETVAMFAIGLGLALAVFSSILLSGYLTFLIASRQKDIGILRALGARRGDVTRIFLFESIMIAALPALLASIGCVVIEHIANYLLKKNYGMVISVLNFGPTQFLIIIGLAVAIAVLSTVLPIRKYSKRKPVDVIKEV